MKNRILSLLAISSVGGLQYVEAQEHPNIILILVDDMGYSDLGCMGSEIRTPNLDLLARKGVLFTHFYNTSRSCPSRASLLTGMYQHKAGIGLMDWNVGTPAYQGFLNDKCVTIAEVLQQSGYRTILAGKWHVGREKSQWPMERGFERFYGIPNGGGLYFYPSKFLDRPIYRNEKIIKPDSATFYSTDNFTTEAIGFMQEAKNESKPFFVYLPYIAPHFPLQAKQVDIDKYKGVYDKGYEYIRNKRFKKQKRLGILAKEQELSPIKVEWDNENCQREALKMEVYAAQMDCLDQNIGRLVDYLKDSKQLDNTVIFFLSDNGGTNEETNRSPEVEIGGADSFVSYGKWANVSNTPYCKYKKFEHEGGIITPLIVHWPRGLKTSRGIMSEPLHIIDLLPTCLEVAKVDYPHFYEQKQILPHDGISFLDHLKGLNPENNRELFWEHMGNKAVRVGDWKLVKAHGRDWELYDLAKDPTELNDLSARNLPKVDELKLKWKKWAVEYGVRSWPLNTKKK